MGTSDFRGNRIGGCCKECTERYEACHDSCDKYQAALKEWKEYKDKVYEAKKLSEYDQYRLKSIDNMRRRRSRYDRRS